MKLSNLNRRNIVSFNQNNENNKQTAPNKNINLAECSKLKAGHFSPVVVAFKSNMSPKGLFKELAMTEDNPKWENAINRQEEMYKKEDDFRTDFERDYDRILHSDAFTRMSKKTQVAPLPHNDNICTRSEHVQIVAQISERICDYMGLNSKLARAIALGHDLGHAPFGHDGEYALKDIIKEDKIDYSFWHEKNGINFVDNIETLNSPSGIKKNLNLTYAVRDGIISHCGEVNQNGLFPREEFIDLYTIDSPGERQPYTWEGCVVKIADKIAYLGRDIEDAQKNQNLSEEKKQELSKIAKESLGVNFDKVNNTNLIGLFVKDICKNSSPEKGIRLSDESQDFMNKVKDFNYKNIYLTKGKKVQSDYAKLIINTVYDDLKDSYKGNKTLENVKKKKEKNPVLYSSFENWLKTYSKNNKNSDESNPNGNKKIYDISKPNDYKKSAIDFISGMTDDFAKRSFEEVLSVR